MFNKLKKIFSSKSTLKDKFSKIYSNNIFGGKDSRSGEGSNLEQTREIRAQLPKLLRELAVKSFMDAPCGDLFWIKEIDLGVERYFGIDIVESLIDSNTKHFGSDSRKFICTNLVDGDLPKVDLIFCRDCLVHLNYSDIKNVISNFKRSGAKYLLTTTFTDRSKNVDLIGRDIWRTLNLEIAPFNFPPPLKLINEYCTERDGKFADKHLGLWLLDDIFVE